MLPNGPQDYSPVFCWFLALLLEVCKWFPMESSNENRPGFLSCVLGHAIGIYTKIGPCICTFQTHIITQILQIDMYFCQCINGCLPRHNVGTLGHAKFRNTKRLEIWWPGGQSLELVPGGTLPDAMHKKLGSETKMILIDKTCLWKAYRDPLNGILMGTLGHQRADQITFLKHATPWNNGALSN